MLAIKISCSLSTNLQIEIETASTQDYDLYMYSCMMMANTVIFGPHICEVQNSLCQIVKDQPQFAE